jgi:hypothetical protein
MLSYKFNQISGGLPVAIDYLPDDAIKRLSLFFGFLPNPLCKFRVVSFGGG